MTMQTDVRSARLTQSGWIVSGPTRVKGISIRGGAGSSTGRTTFFDTSNPPVSVTYAQSGNTVTVTSTAHGLVTGQQIGIAYYPNSSSNNSATNGNYTITVTGANTFTITDPNSNTVASGTTCLYAVGGNYLVTFGIPSGDVYIDYWKVPGEGLRAYQKVYAYLDSGLIDSTTVFYG
jgi:hypothetical protein